jgi:hypothetical protein
VLNKYGFFGVQPAKMLQFRLRLFGKPRFARAAARYPLRRTSRDGCTNAGQAPALALKLGSHHEKS